jgi:hypothetical protein
MVAAHNLAFDGPFLAHQFRQIGADVPLGIDSGLCTMMLAATYLPEAGRGLAACCAAADISLENAHRALDDTTRQPVRDVRRGLREGRRSARVGGGDAVYVLRPHVTLRIDER